jgi:hypothetical protein
VPCAPRRRGGRQTARFSVKVEDRGRRGGQTEIGPPAVARCVDAAVPIRSNLLRLEHELHTVVNGSARAAAITRLLSSDTASAAHIAAGTSIAR